MKKSILTLVTLGVAVSAMGQGIVNFSTRVSGTVVARVYGTDLANVAKTGNTASDTPAGVQTYAGALLTGSGFSASLWAAVGGGQSVGALALVPGSLTSFRTGATLGGTPNPNTSLVIPGVVASSGVGTFQVRAWDNAGGTITSWGDASIRGESNLFDLTGLGDGILLLPADLAGVRSFNLTIIPEPSTFVLAGMGAAALLIFRRRK